MCRVLEMHEINLETSKMELITIPFVCNELLAKLYEMVLSHLGDDNEIHIREADMQSTNYERCYFVM
jgi:hypothetical protein